MADLRRVLNCSSSGACAPSPLLGRTVHLHPVQPFLRAAGSAAGSALAFTACSGGDVKEGARVLAALARPRSARRRPGASASSSSAHAVHRAPAVGRRREHGGLAQPLGRRFPGRAVRRPSTSRCRLSFCSAHAKAPSPRTQILIVPGGGQLARIPAPRAARADDGQRQAPWNTHLLTRVKRGKAESRSPAGK